LRLFITAKPHPATQQTGVLTQYEIRNTQPHHPISM